MTWTKARWMVRRSARVRMARMIWASMRIRRRKAASSTTKPRENFGKKRGGKRLFGPREEGRGPAGEKAGNLRFRPKHKKQKPKAQGGENQRRGEHRRGEHRGGKQGKQVGKHGGKRKGRR